eukprot:scaffold935_cov334-Prasinococcus_capsulatus_cf.AAC.4
MDLGISRAELEREVLRVCEANGMTSGVHIRLMCTRGLKPTPYQACGRPPSRCGCRLRGRDASHVRSRSYTRPRRLMLCARAATCNTEPEDHDGHADDRDHPGAQAGQRGPQAARHQALHRARAPRPRGRAGPDVEQPLQAQLHRRLHPGQQGRCTSLPRRRALSRRLLCCCCG